MQKNKEPVYYGDYLGLDKLLGAQSLHSSRYGEPAHDEMLFIIVHQAYELWFKQILHEMHSVIETFSAEKVEDQQLPQVVHRLKRVVAIQKLLNDQIAIMETMTPQDFLSFRDYLVPASGFQSIQFKMLEISLGLKRAFRIDFDQQSFLTRLNDEDRAFLTRLEGKPSVFELVDKWLARMPFLDLGEFKFWQHYRNATEDMLVADAETIKANDTLSEEQISRELAELDKVREHFSALFDTGKYTQLQERGDFRLSHQAMLAALFIEQYREEPMFNLAHQFITCLTEIDENMTIWRFRHAMMVQRMLGSKIGTGGSSGHEYLKRTTEANRVFTDFFNMATFLLPKGSLPQLPDSVRSKLRFQCV